MNNTSPAAGTEGGVADFFTRVINNEGAKRGVAGAIVCVLFAVITEGVWPRKS